MNKIEYDTETSLGNFMDQYMKNRLERIIWFEGKCTPSDDQLVEACKVLIEHINGVRGWK
jgi:hypothetical protein